MKLVNSVLTIAFLCFFGSLKAQEYNPFKSIGKKGKIVNAYGDKFVETFDIDTIQRIGSVLFDIKNKRIVELLPDEKVFRKFTNNSSASRWMSPDPMAYLYFSISPYAFVANNPISNTDPDGRMIVGSTRDDAKTFLTDLQAMLKDKAYDQFRSLVSVKGKTFNKIDQAAFDKATSGLSEDQMAFAQTVFGTINSADTHMVEYVDKTGDASTDASTMMNEKVKGAFTASMAQNDGKLKGTLIEAIWGSTTLKTKDGTYSVIIKGTDGGGSDYYNSDTKTKGKSPVGQAGVAGHEVFGHGRGTALKSVGEDASAQHVQAIQMENLILRVMGQGNTQRTGEDHGTKTKVEAGLPKVN